MRAIVFCTCDFISEVSEKRVALCIIRIEALFERTFIQTGEKDTGSMEAKRYALISRY